MMSQIFLLQCKVVYILFLTAGSYLYQLDRSKFLVQARELEKSHLENEACGVAALVLQFCNSVFSCEFSTFLHTLKAGVG